MGTSHVVAWVDGSGTARGPAGWGAVLLWVSAEGEVLGEREFSDGIEEGTNQVAELTAALRALEKPTRPVRVTIVSDSRYVVDGMTQRWIDNWRRNGWRNAQRKPVANKPLWEALDAAAARHLEVRWRHVNGHSGHVYNERADVLAGLARRKVLEARAVV